MNRDDIIRMAREVGAYYAAIDEATGQEFLTLPEQAFERFAAIVAAAEREACMEQIGILVEAEREACAQIAFNAKTYIEAAAAIRARGEK
jgi:putative hemolysin